MLKKVMLWLLVMATCLAGTMLLWIGYMVSSTNGTKIQSYSDPQKALMIIDLQEDLTGTTATSPFPYKNSAKLISTVNVIIQTAEKRGMPIIFVNQEFRGILGTLWSKLFVGGRLLKGRSGTATDKRLRSLSFKRFTKPKGDAFSNPDLEKYLIKNKVKDLYVVGVDAEYCVYLTAKGAISRGYDVYAIVDGIGLMNADKWEKIREKYRKTGITLMEGDRFEKVSP